MKKLFIFLLVLILPLLRGAPQERGGRGVSAEAAPQYARVLSGRAMLYRTNSGAEENDNRYFLLPDGYYVGLTGVAAENYYKVAYDGLNGWVKAEDVDIVSYVPKLKYASGQTLKIELKDSDYCNFREFPATSSQKLIEAGIPNGTEDIKFYNYVTAGTVNWYFIEYGGQKGYVHGDYAVVTKEIAVNDGAAEPVLDLTDPSELSGNKSKQPQPLNLTTLIILIAVIGIPAVVIIFMLFRPRRRRPAYRPARADANRVPRYLDEGYRDKDG